MNTLTIILVMVAIIVTMGAVIYVLIRDRKAQKKRNTGTEKRNKFRKGKCKAVIRLHKKF